MQKTTKDSVTIASLFRRQISMKKYLLLLTALLLLTVANGQTNFHMRYGSPYFDRARQVIQTQDGNFVIVGQTDGFGSAGNAFIMKVGITGSILWIKDYFGINTDMMWDIIELSDKNLVMCGTTNSYGAGTNDGFMMKTDSSGNLIWARAYGNIWAEEFYHLSKDDANGFYVAGLAQDASGNTGTTIIRMDNLGNVLWARWVNDWSAMGDWWPIDFTPLAAGGVVLCGASSTTSDVEVWKFSSSGNLVWSKRFSPGGYGYSIIENGNGDILINHSFSSTTTVAQSLDNCVLKLDSNGNIIWDKCYGGTYVDWLRSISNTSDGGTIICGQTNSAGNGDEDACLIKINSNGAVQWAKAYGTPWRDRPANAVQTTDGGFVLTGQTWSIGTDHDSSKVHLVKTDSLGNSSCHDISWNPVMSNQSISVSTPAAPINFSFQENQITWALNNRSFYTTDICNPTSVFTISSTDLLNVYPNPFSIQTTLQTAKSLQNASLTIYNSVGQTVKRMHNLAGQTIVFHRDNLPSGLYFVRLIQDGNTISADKFVIADE